MDSNTVTNFQNFQSEPRQLQILGEIGNWFKIDNRFQQSIARSGRYWELIQNQLQISGKNGNWFKINYEIRKKLAMDPKSIKNFTRNCESVQNQMRISGEIGNWSESDFKF